MKIREFPVGTEVGITTALFHCKKCGKKAENVTYFATATADYCEDEAVERRAFKHNGAVLCDCSDVVWLACDD